MKEELHKKLLDVQNAIPKADWWIYNLESIENFIHHLYSIENEKEQVKTAKEIGAYLDLAVTLFNNSGKYGNKKKLEPHLHKLSINYDYDAGFIVKPNIFLTLILHLIIFAVLMTYFDLFYSTITTLIIGIVIGVYYWIRIKEKRYY